MDITTKKAFKYKITFTISKVKIAIQFPCKMSLIYKKGGTQLEVKTPVEFDTELMEANFQNQKIEFESVYFKDKLTGFFIGEPNYVKTYILTKKGNKTSGIFKIDPSNFLNNGRLNFENEEVSLMKCPDEDAVAFFGMKFQRIGELSYEEVK